MVQKVCSPNYVSSVDIWLIILLTKTGWTHTPWKRRTNTIVFSGLLLAVDFMLTIHPVPMSCTGTLVAMIVENQKYRVYRETDLFSFKQSMLTG